MLKFLFPLKIIFHCEVFQLHVQTPSMDVFYPFFYLDSKPFMIGSIYFFSMLVFSLMVELKFGIDSRSGYHGLELMV